MNRLNFVASAAVALVLSACSGAPAWNTSVFPEQPEYGMAGTPDVEHVAFANIAGE